MTCEQSKTGEVYVAAYRGDTITLDVTLYDSYSLPVDVTGWAWAAEVRDSTGAQVTEFTVTDTGIAGTLLLELTDVVTAGLAVADYTWDLEATDAGSDVRTLVQGRLRIREDVSQ